MAGAILAYDLLRVVRNPDYYSGELRLGMMAAPFYERFADAGRHVIRAIHAIPTLFDDGRDSLDQIEVYVGRAGATPRHIHSRWRYHLDEKNHDHGAIVLRCSSDIVDLWETAAVRAIKSLELRGRLCVRNASASGRGPLPGTEESVIYITWKGGPRRDIAPADRRIIDEVAREVADGVPDLNLDTLRRALDPITRPVHERADVGWHPMHDGEADDDPNDE